jgi:hypothetical protein
MCIATEHCTVYPVYRIILNWLRLLYRHEYRVVAISLLGCVLAITPWQPIRLTISQTIIILVTVATDALLHCVTRT